LKLIAEKEEIPLEQCVAVGDGSNDRWMVATAGAGIAFHAKLILRQATPHHINISPLSVLAWILDLPIHDISKEHTDEHSELFTDSNQLKAFPKLHDWL